jgi:predicted small lipoprotein YifL
MVGLCTLLVIAGLTACGKRGDPFRPAEIPTQKISS